LLPNSAIASGSCGAFVMAAGMRPDPHPCDAGNSSDHVMELDVHEGPRLLRVLDMRCGVVSVLLASS
jgi:hypothetical protein